MGLFGRRHKSQADITLQDLQQAADARQQGAVQPAPARLDDPSTDQATSFTVSVERVVPIKHVGAVIWGQVTVGTIRVGQPARVASRPTGPSFEVSAIEVGKKRRQSAQAGDAVGLVFKGLTDKDVRDGDQIVG